MAAKKTSRNTKTTKKTTKAKRKVAAKKAASALPALTYQDLASMVRDINISDEKLAQYFVLDESNSGPFQPTVIPNPALIADDGLESALAINIFNKLARIRRNAKYKQRIKNWNGVKIVAEGDSWFQYPLLLKDTIDHLIDLDQFEYAIYGLSEAGDLLSNILVEDEISEALERESPDVFLISGGGNDMVDDERIATMVHPFSASRKAVDYPNAQFDDFLNSIEKMYRSLFHKVLRQKPHIKIVCHGYDNVIPNNGEWLGRPLASVKIKDPALQQEILAEIIKRFNERLINIAKDFPGAVYHIDCRGLVGSQSNWHDELHPKKEGYLKVAQKIDATIKQALADNAAAPALNLEKSSVGLLANSKSNEPNIKLAKVQKLDNKEFLNLVVKRATQYMGKEIAMPSNEYERKMLEKDISNYFEKIHKDANFLPSSFLENGVKRAQAVCRITTDTSYGSGFLIGSRDFIITNNHVIKDIATAKASIAEFDYDEDDIEYEVSFAPERFFVTNKELDFTIIACDSTPLPADIEAIALLEDADTITRGERVNIIQHPRGRRKEISLHDNKVNYVYDIGIRYTADTEGGSSGSPVFNNQWNLVALHHAGWSETDGSATNEGIRIASIVEFLNQQNQQESSSELESLLNCVQSCDNLTTSPAHKTTTRPKPTKPRNQSASNKSLVLNIDGDIDELTIRLNR